MLGVDKQIPVNKSEGNYILYQKWLHINLLTNETLEWLLTFSLRKDAS